MSELKPDLVIRGERRSESLKSPILDGHIENGVTYHLPIYEWSDKEVLDFLEKEMGELPFHFFFNESSLDCMGCTAYSAHTSDRIEWMKENYPEQYKLNKEKQEKQKRYLLDKLKDF